jgi:membrane protease YdiL (CAAX protease family)
MALVFYALLAGAAGVWGVLAGRSIWFASPADQARGPDLALDLAVGALAGGIVIAISRAMTLQTRWGDALGRMLGAVLGPLSRTECVLLALLSGVAEEAFFRGALQPAVGWVWASLLFGLAHFAPRRELLPWTAFTVAAGFLLGLLFDRTGNLIAPIVAHFIINAVNLRFLAVRYGHPQAH